MPEKDFSFIQNRSPLKKAAIEENFSVWKDPLAGFEPPSEEKLSDTVRQRLANRGLF